MLQDHGKAPHECSSTYLDIVPRHQEARRWKTLLSIHTQVSPHTSAHVQRRAFQHRVRAAFQWRGPADDHHLGEHRLRGHREPGAHLQERHHQRLVALAALSTCCLNGFSPWSLDLHRHNFGFKLDLLFTFRWPFFLCFHLVLDTCLRPQIIAVAHRYFAVWLSVWPLFFRSQSVWNCYF